ALFQILPALLLIAVLSFSAAVIRPLVLTTIQNEASDEVRATVLSMQSLMFAALLAVSEPILGSIADQSGFPAIYVGLAGALGLFMVLVFWRGRPYFARRFVSM